MLTKPLTMLRVPYASMPPDRIIAWRNETPIRNQEFQTRVQAWYTLLKDNAGRKFALYLSDSLEFACALFGSWLAEKTLYLPSDKLPATCESLRNSVDGYLGEFSAEYAPLIPVNEQYNYSGDKSLKADLAGLIIYTSGTTGNAQAIPKYLRQLAAEVATLENLFGNLLGDAEIVATVSHEHIYGILFKILWPLTAGRVIHIRSAIFPEELIPVLTTHDCVLVASPAHLKRFPASPAFTHLTNALHVRALFSSGGPLALAAAQAAAQLFGKIPIEIYGSSETGGIAWRQRTTQLTDESWQPVPGVKWRLTRNNLLEIQSPHLADNNWLCLADHAIAATENYFILQGRADRIVKLAGKRISLDAIERALVAVPLAAEARVIMIDENNQREHIAAFIVLTAAGQAVLAKFGKLALNQQLRAALLNSVPLIALPRSWRYLNALPVNSQGKTTHAELMALLDKPKPTIPQQKLLEQTAQHVLLELTIPKDLCYFAGHFPTAPILPGVVQIDWAIAFGKQYFKLSATFKGLHNLKFQNVIQPGMKVLLELQHDINKSILIFRWYSPAGRHASGSILFSTNNTEEQQS